MPSLENFLPTYTPKALEHRSSRARKIMHALQITEPTRIALNIRREVKEWSAMLAACMSMGPAGCEQAATATKALIATRAQFLDIIGLPKRPGRPMVDERTVKMIRDAMPEEIVLPEEIIEPPPAAPPATTV